MILLADLDGKQRGERFALLQEGIKAVWAEMRHDHDDESVVVLPSLAIDPVSLPSAGLVQAYEERFLFLLLLLRQPRLRMVYVTSTRIEPRIVEYYLALLPGVIPSHARERLTLISVDDSSLRPLAEKILERPRILALIASKVPNRGRCHLIAYAATDKERDIALTLGVPMYGCDPRLSDLGSKTGCRRIFDEEGVAHPAGAEDLHSPEDVVVAISALLAEHPAMAEVIVKLNDGVAGNGNASIDVRHLGGSGVRSAVGRADVGERVAALQLESPWLSRREYWARFEQLGGVVEERITGVELRSPSVQMRVLPDGDVELLSTHDQLLGGPRGQAYLGCTFPADGAYSRLISEPAMVVGRRLAHEGVLGRFAVDFVVVRDADGAWAAYAIEINLRKGGTTHPFLTLQFLTDGRYDGASGQFLTATGHQKHLVASDHLEAEELRSLRIGDLFDVVAMHGLHFDHARQTGVVFHMISCLSERGRVGVTAIGDDPLQAMSLYGRAEEALIREATAAGRSVALPA